jgi:hypothetical protein
MHMPAESSPDTGKQRHITAGSPRFQLCIKPCLSEARRLSPEKIAMLNFRRPIEPKPDLFCGR